MNLTIIIPMYNVEKYIGKCIESVMNQNWLNTSFEIVVVDDQSPDASLQIAKSYSNKYPSCVTIISQINKGLGGARNTGVLKAKGEFLFFLDSDDYLVNNQLPHLVKTAIENQLDILEFAASRVDENYNQIDTVFHNHTTAVCSSDQYLETINFSNSACNKLYRREFLLQNNIKFFEKTLIEDAPFNVEAFIKASRIMAVDIIPVAYLQNPNSITRSKRTVTTQIKFIEHSIRVTTHMASFQNTPNTIKAQNRIKSRIATFVSGVLLAILKADINAKNKFNYIDDLKEVGLYPYAPKSNSAIRDVFMWFMSKPLILKCLIRFS